MPSHGSPGYSKGRKSKVTGDVYTSLEVTLVRYTLPHNSLLEVSCSLINLIKHSRAEFVSKAEVK